MDDTFRGDDAHLVRSIEAHLALDAAGALVPHGVGGLARVLLASAAARLSAALARSGQAASGSQENARSDVRTGWPPGLLQDDSRELSRALASKPDAMVHARDAVAKIGQPEAPTAAPLDERGWLIEHSGETPGTSARHVSWLRVRPKFGGYGAKEFGFTHDASDALRFARREDAEAVLAMHMGAKPPDWYRRPFSVTEHLWPHPSARSGAAPKSDHCPEKLKPGGCQLHNLHCGYPKCNEPPAARSGEGSEDAERAARAPFEARYPSKILWKRGGSVFAEDVPGAEYVDQGVQRDWELWLEAWNTAVAPAQPDRSEEPR